MYKSSNCLNNNNNNNNNNFFVFFLFFFAEGVCKNLLKDTREGSTLPGVWDFYQLKTHPRPPLACICLWAGSAQKAPPSLPSAFMGKFSVYFFLFLSPVGGRKASFLSLLFRVKDRLDEDGDPNTCCHGASARQRCRA